MIALVCLLPPVFIAQIKHYYYNFYYFYHKENFIRHIKHKKKQSVINNDIYNHYFYVDINDILQT